MSRAGAPAQGDRTASTPTARGTLIVYVLAAKGGYRWRLYFRSGERRYLVHYGQENTERDASEAASIYLRSWADNLARKLATAAPDS